MNRPPSSAVFRLTALWALCESGLGGWMHALHLPLTGFFVGAISIIIISLLAHYSGGSIRQVLQATFTVILVKAAVSPQSPPPAYAAVAFQGITGAVLLALLPFRMGCLLLGIITMLESALQKLIIATLIFGKSLWRAIDLFFDGILKEFHLADLHFSYGLIAAYLLVYAMWGAWVGVWMGTLPAKLAAGWHQVQMQSSTSTAAPALPYQPARKYAKLLSGIAALAFIVFVFLTGKQYLPYVWYVIARTVAVVVVLVWVVQPLFRQVMQRLVSSRRRKGDFAEVMAQLPKLRSLLQPSYRAAMQERGLWRRFRVFVFTLISLTIYLPDEQ